MVNWKNKYLKYKSKLEKLSGGVFSTSSVGAEAAAKKTHPARYMALTARRARRPAQTPPPGAAGEQVAEFPPPLPEGWKGLRPPICCSNDSQCGHLSCVGPRMNCPDGQNTCIKPNHFLVSGHGGMIDGMDQGEIDILKESDRKVDKWFVVDKKYTLISLGNVGQVTVSGKLAFISDLYLSNKDVKNKMTLELGRDQRLQLRGPPSVLDYYIGITSEFERRTEKHVSNNQAITFENAGRCEGFDPGGIFPLPIYHEDTNNNRYEGTTYTLQDLFGENSTHNLKEGVYILSICRGERTSEDEEILQSGVRRGDSLSRKISAEHNLRRSGSQGQVIFDERQDFLRESVRREEDKDNAQIQLETILFKAFFVNDGALSKKILADEYSFNIFLDGLLNEVLMNEFITDNFNYDDILSMFVITLRRIIKHFEVGTTKYDRIININLDNYYKRHKN